MLEHTPRFPVEFHSREEAACAALLTKHLGWDAINGKTYQRPISTKHDADFFLPELNLIVEYHPPVIKWYSPDSTFSRLKRLQRTLSPYEYSEVQELLTQQISYDYYKRRRAIMDISDIEGVNKMRLIVADSPHTFFRDVLKPHSSNHLTFQHFKNEWNQLTTRKRGRG